MAVMVDAVFKNTQQVLYVEMVIGLPGYRHKLDQLTLTLDNFLISHSLTVKNLRVICDSCLFLEHHIKLHVTST